MVDEDSLVTILLWLLEFSFTMYSTHLGDASVALCARNLITHSSRVVASRPY
jgi:hypothetical protein